jgi:hypothetical protein
MEGHLLWVEEGAELVCLDCLCILPHHLELSQTFDFLLLLCPEHSCWDRSWVQPSTSLVEGDAFGTKTCSPNHRQNVAGIDQEWEEAGQLIGHRLRPGGPDGAGEAVLHPSLRLLWWAEGEVEYEASSPWEHYA